MPASSSPPSVAVIGAGSFGRNHLRVYRELEDAGLCRLVAVVDENEAGRSNAAAKYNIAAFASVAELLAAQLPIAAVSVCVPTTHHAAVAEPLLRAGIDTMIEKPFASSLAEADTILALAEASGRIVQIGHLERFNPAVTAVLPLLNRPMFFEAHRLSIFTPRSLDVDVVLDLMIHDLDIVLQLAASPVRELRAVGLPVLSRTTDIANVRLEFDSGCIANFTASRVSTEQVRKLRFFQPQQYLSLDFARQELLTINVDADTDLGGPTGELGGPSFAAVSQRAGSEALKSVTELHEGALAPEGQTDHHPSPGLSLKKLATERVEPLRLELEDFLRAVTTRTQSQVTGAQGRAALSLALEINAAIAAHARRAGL